MKSGNMVFGICSFYEPPEQLNWCLSHIRRAYCHEKVFVISDGSWIDYSSICEENRASYTKGERLKSIDKGALWWLRFFSTGMAFLKSRNDVLIKLDPDTKIHRRIRGKPPADMSGCMERNYHIQGGFQCFTYDAVKKILDSGICHSEKFLDSSYWLPPNEIYPNLFRAYHDTISTDFVLKKITEELGLSLGHWDEIESYYTTMKFRGDAAVTHPHKADWQKPSLDTLVVNYKRPHNTTKVLQSLKNQTLPTRVTLLDCSPSEEFSCSTKFADRVFKFDNMGTINRFMTAAACFDVDFVCFHDEDLVPAEGMLEFYYNCWGGLEKPGILSQFGRLLKNRCYNWNEVQPYSVPRKVDVVVRSYFSTPENINSAHGRFLKLMPKESIQFDEDILYCAMLSMSGHNNYITPQPQGHQRASSEELDKTFSLHHGEGHIERRTKLCQKLMNMGWVSQNGQVKLL